MSPIHLLVLSNTTTCTASMNGHFGEFAGYKKLGLKVAGLS